MSELAKPSNTDFIQSGVAKVHAGIKDYVAIIRPDYWVKNIFIIPGILFAIAVYHVPITGTLLLKILIGFISTCMVASANYVINEYLDAEFDKFHPLKTTNVCRKSGESKNYLCGICATGNWRARSWLPYLFQIFRDTALSVIYGRDVQRQAVS